MEAQQIAITHAFWSRISYRLGGKQIFSPRSRFAWKMLRRHCKDGICLNKIVSRQLYRTSYVQVSDGINIYIYIIYNEWITYRHASMPRCVTLIGTVQIKHDRFSIGRSRRNRSSDLSLVNSAPVNRLLSISFLPFSLWLSPILPVVVRSCD